MNALHKLKASLFKVHLWFALPMLLQWVHQGLAVDSIDVQSRSGNWSDFGNEIIISDLSGDARIQLVDEWCSQNSFKNLLFQRGSRLDGQRLNEGAVHAVGISEVKKEVFSSRIEEVRLSDMSILEQIRVIDGVVSKDLFNTGYRQTRSSIETETKRVASISNPKSSALRSGVGESESFLEKVKEINLRKDLTPERRIELIDEIHAQKSEVGFK